MVTSIYNRIRISSKVLNDYAIFVSITGSGEAAEGVRRV